MSIAPKLKHAQIVNPSDTLPLPHGSIWLSFINTGAQTLTIDTFGGETGVVIVLPSGMWQIAAAKVYATGTTVTNIVAYWE